MSTGIGIGKLKTEVVQIGDEEFTLRKLSCPQVEALMAVYEEAGEGSFKALYHVISCSVINPDDNTYKFTPQQEKEVMENSSFEAIQELSTAIMAFNGLGDEDDQGK